MRILWLLLEALRDLHFEGVRMRRQMKDLTDEANLLREALKPPDLRAIKWTIEPPEGE